ncbi:hypothetical protein [Listeria cornellensis]|uniref:Uncharacterized protein n=1 Tax=Listeria cornellensis FSL F6-0969 TaxID=1265820 RepID=W7BWS5_9LIST|nr:hypothetical protein [Listeria cornellensis]EUJ30192.1 hypothetical protein PCORN_08807 [Listeria cornellensis FSL F6-0969]
MQKAKKAQMILIKVLCCVAILCVSFVPFFNETVEAKAINSHTYSDYFKKVTWIKRNGVWSLSVEPKSTLTKNYGNANVQGAHASRSYKLLENKHKKKQVLEKQRVNVKSILMSCSICREYKIALEFRTIKKKNIVILILLRKNVILEMEKQSMLK